MTIGRRHTLLCIVGATCLLVTVLSALPSEWNLNDQQTRYDDALQRIEESHTGNVQKLSQGYVDALKSHQNKLRGERNTIGLRIIDLELARYERDNSLSTNEFIGQSRHVERIQKAYLASLERIRLQRHRDILANGDRYVAYLVRKKKALVKEDEIEAARQIEEEITRIDSSENITEAQTAISKAATREKELRLQAQAALTETAAKERDLRMQPTIAKVKIIAVDEHNKRVQVWQNGEFLGQLDGAHGINSSPQHVTVDTKGAIYVQHNIAMGYIKVTRFKESDDEYVFDRAVTGSGLAGGPPCNWSISDGGGMAIDPRRDTLHVAEVLAKMNADCPPLYSGVTAPIIQSYKRRSKYIDDEHSAGFQLAALPAGMSPLTCAVNNKDGSIYVGDRDSGMLVVLNKRLKIIANWNTGFAGVAGIAVAADGRSVWVTDAVSKRIGPSQFDGDGNLIQLVKDTPGLKRSTWHRAYALAVDGAGYVYVSDHDRIVRMDPAGRWPHVVAGYDGPDLLTNRDAYPWAFTDGIQDIAVGPLPSSVLSK